MKNKNAREESFFDNERCIKSISKRGVKDRRPRISNIATATWNRGETGTGGKESGLISWKVVRDL